MNHQEKKQDVVPIKVPYASPRLDRLGTLRDLTRAKGGSSGDMGSGGSTRP